MVTLEALNALYGDCLLLRYPGSGNRERLWIIDGGPRSATVDGKRLTVWKDVLLPRIKEINANAPVPVALGMVSHIDDDHINGMQKLTDALISAGPGNPPAVKFSRFWFNSFDDLVGPKPAGLPQEAATTSLQSLVSGSIPGIKDDHAKLIMESVAQGVSLADDIGTLQLKDNKPINGLVMAEKGQQKYNIEGAIVTVIGPLKKRVEKLRKDWEKALKKKTKKARQAALQELFLPDKKLDSSVPNLSSIVVLVEVGGRKLLLTGDANGHDVVTGWKQLGLGNGLVQLDVLKMPHHGSIRNTTKDLLTFFRADHYVFSANGKYDNPDPPAVEAVVKLNGTRNIVLHFTNANITWSKRYKLEKGGKSVKNLSDMLDALHDAYPGPWKANLRKPTEKGVSIQLG
ncbi:MAG: hypothetical protein P8Y71_03905 [Pseudolabrys sp.]|jgi:hypothetical protein